MMAVKRKDDRSRPVSPHAVISEVAGLKSMSLGMQLFADRQFQPDPEIIIEQDDQ